MTGNYWEYPTGSDYVPNAEVPPGGSNSANWFLAVGGTSDVGAYVNSASPYGTFDQGGNVAEWNETVRVYDSSQRGVLGGSWGDEWLHASNRYDFTGAPSNEAPRFGFRVASIPEPSTLLLGAMAAAGLLLRRRRMRS